MYIDSGQNVGIGTSSPTRLLDVTTTGALAAIAVIQNTSTASAQLRVKNPQNESIFGVDTSTGGLTGTANATYIYTGNYPILFSPNGTERMRIDTSGRVTMPYQPCFYATVTGSGTVAGITVIPFNSTVVNIGSCFNTSTYRFTAPVAGTYMFIAQPSFNGASTARVSIRRNGSFYFEYEGEGTTNGWLTTTFGSLITMAVNDYVDMYNGNNSLAYDASRWMGFYGYLIG
jgi:hypothetical protein